MAGQTPQLLAKQVQDQQQLGVDAQREQMQQQVQNQQMAQQSAIQRGDAEHAQALAQDDREHETGNAIVQQAAAHVGEAAVAGASQKVTPSRG